MYVYLCEAQVCCDHRDQKRMPVSLELNEVKGLVSSCHGCWELNLDS